jgi:GTP-binding protein
LREAAFRQPPPASGSKRPRLYYATQVAIEPPTFVFFASDAASVHFSYRRYLENRIRAAFGFAGTPVRLVFREREREEGERKRKGARRPTKRAPAPAKAARGG